MNDIQSFILNHLNYYKKSKDKYDLNCVLDKLNLLLSGAPKNLKYDSIYYRQGQKECIEVIKEITGDKFEGYCIGNIIKYIYRYKYKHKDIYNQYIDIYKAKWYLEYLLKTLPS